MNSLIESLFGFRFMDPWLLFLALAPPLTVWVRKKMGAPAIGFSPAALVKDRSFPSWRIGLARVPRALQILGLVLMVTALARPVRRDQLPFETEGVDIILCLDVSSSMTAKDMKKDSTRMDVAKDAAVAFIKERPQDRIGLISFARYPDVRCPLTLDHRALEELMQGMAPVKSDSPEDATGVGAAIARGAQALKHGKAKSKVLILLTDGEENVATQDTPKEIPPIHGAQLCNELGVRIYAILAGEGRRDPSGQWIEPDTLQVEQATKKTGGRFFKARDAEAMTQVYLEINALEKMEFKAPRYNIEERFFVFLYMAIGLLICGRLLQSTLLEVLP